MGAKERNIALLVDGPNMIRKREFGFGTEEILKAAEKYGKVHIKEVFLNKYAESKLIESVINRGFAIGDIGIEDIDVPYSSRATELICSPRYDYIDTIALATRDGDFARIFHRAKNYNKETIAIGADDNFSPALRRAADYVETLELRSNSDGK